MGYYRIFMILRPSRYVVLVSLCKLYIALLRAMQYVSPIKSLPTPHLHLPSFSHSFLLSIPTLHPSPFSHLLFLCSISSSHSHSHSHFLHHHHHHHHPSTLRLFSSYLSFHSHHLYSSITLSLHHSVTLLLYLSINLIL